MNKIYFTIAILIISIIPLNRAGSQDLTAKAINIPTASLLGIITAYTSREEETDSTPFTTASNQQVRDGIIANNCLPFGTQVAIQTDKVGRLEVYRVFEVQDRMNRRYDCNHWDIWFEKYSDAIKFGRQTKKIEILNNL